MGTPRFGFDILHTAAALNRRYPTKYQRTPIIRRFRLHLFVIISMRTLYGQCFRTLSNIVEHSWKNNLVEWIDAPPI